MSGGRLVELLERRVGLCKESVVRAGLSEETGTE